MDPKGKSAASASGTIPTLFSQAVQYHNAGKIPDAEKSYRQILAINPRHPYALNNLAMIGYDFKRYEAAEQLVRKALAERDDVPLFHDTLGNILKAQKKTEEAIESFETALELQPDFIDSLNNLGGTLFTAGRAESALPLFRRALFFSPGNFNALNNIGAVLQYQGKHREAIDTYRMALEAQPKVATVYYNIAIAQRELGLVDEALATLHEALEYDPNYADAALKIGYILGDLGKFNESLVYFNRVNAIRPDPNAYANIGHALQKQGKYEEALVAYKKAHELLPGSFQILNNTGSIYNLLTSYEEAMECFNKALALEPNSEDTLSNVGSVYKNMGKLDDAIIYYKKAAELAPHKPWIYSNLLLAMLYASSVSPGDLAAASFAFGKNIADPLLRDRPLICDTEPERKLRIGYVSADFRGHAVHYFFEPLLNLHSHDQFEIFLYSNTQIEDDVSERMKKECDHWRDIRLLSDDAIANLIEHDEIDILVDISGHTGYNKLMVFARKPAPVQVTWLGYPGTTGMKAIDYKITDHYAEPEGMTEQFNAEKLWRLPGMFCCYQAHEKSPAVIDHPPFEDNGYITFGCFNNFAKVSDPALQTWAKIMEEVLGSKILLEISGIDAPKFRSEVEERLERNGLSLDRVILEQRLRTNQFVLYNRIDIALDPFPCNGGTTSMDTLWMGVPFVTMAGKHFNGRLGVTVLSNAGLPELITRNIDEYISVAVKLANDRERLKKLRHNLRDRTDDSPLMDQVAFGKNMETAFREMWREYCASEKSRKS